MDPIELRTWIATSLRTQKRVVVAAVVLLSIGFVLWLGQMLPTLVTSVIMLFAVILGICGFWVTAAHISDWRMQLDRLDRIARSKR